MKERLKNDVVREERLKTVSVHMPVVFYEALKYLVKAGAYPSVAEAVRSAVRDLIVRDQILLEEYAELLGKKVKDK